MKPGLTPKERLDDAAATVMRGLCYWLLVLVGAFALIVAVIFVAVVLFAAFERASINAEPNRFSAALEIEEVLASKRNHSWFGNTFQCHYEFVRMSEVDAARFAHEDADEIIYPPAGRDTRRMGQNAHPANRDYIHYNGAYRRPLRPTPMPPMSEMPYRLLDTYYCLWSDDANLEAIVRKAAHEPGSWYTESGILIIPEHRIAAWGYQTD